MPQTYLEQEKDVLYYTLIITRKRELIIVYPKNAHIYYKEIFKNRCLRIFNYVSGVNRGLRGQVADAEYPITLYDSAKKFKLTFLK